MDNLISLSNLILKLSDLCFFHCFDFLDSLNVTLYKMFELDLKFLEDKCIFLEVICEFFVFLPESNISFFVFILKFS